jgi:hypothetical protein
MAIRARIVKEGRALGRCGPSRPVLAGGDFTQRQLRDRFMRWRMSLSENRFPLFRDMR